MNDYQEICKNFPNLENLIFISCSKLDTSRQAFLYNDLIIKTHNIKEDNTQHLRQNNLQQEYELLKDCKKIRGIPKAYSYCENNGYILLLVSYLQGTSLTNLKLSVTQLLKLLIGLSNILFRLSLRGISHNDIVPDNILISKDFKVMLIDFDQATKNNFLVAFCRQFFGINIGESKVNYSIITVLKYYLKKKFPKTMIRLKKFLGKKHLEIERLPTLDADADNEHKKLLGAWELAQLSNASSPGVPIAYYALEFDGIYFPGERPWADRWKELKNISDYSNKTIIELGCNMGLLSVSLLKYAGAKKCIGVDHDSSILKSAKMISEVFNVTPYFFQIDFDSKSNWEEELYSFNADIIFVLNVLNWVKDKKRFLRFLSKFNEVIFEGHDLPEVEKNNFTRLGFTSIQEIGYSERERIILRCRK